MKIYKKLNKIWDKLHDKYKWLISIGIDISVSGITWNILCRYPTSPSCIKCEALQYYGTFKRCRKKLKEFYGH